jgi:hypothetical protein
MVIGLLRVFIALKPAVIASGNKLCREIPRKWTFLEGSYCNEICGVMEHSKAAQPKMIDV